MQSQGRDGNLRDYEYASNGTPSVENHTGLWLESLPTIGLRRVRRR
ncbi:hypothetical protein ES702_01594 [subsurface metagenome]